MKNFIQMFLSSFTDIDECQTGRHSCHRYATCADVPGDYSCFCKEGFSGNGQTCFGKAFFSPYLADLMYFYFSYLRSL